MGPTLKILDPNKLLETLNSDSKRLCAAICFYYPPFPKLVSLIFMCGFGEFVIVVEDHAKKGPDPQSNSLAFALEVGQWLASHLTTRRQ